MTLRQKRILEGLPACGILFDVGCDHGIIGLSALKAGKAERVVFTDISEQCLNKARRLVCDSGLGHRCEFVCGDGLCGRKAESALIAGLGGLEISKILSEAVYFPDMLLLQPMRNAPELRRFLQKKYFLQLDEMFFDRKFYNLILAVKGSDNLSEDEIKYGKTNLRQKSVDFHKYLFAELSKCDKILANGNYVPDVALRKEELIRLSSGLEKL